MTYIVSYKRLNDGKVKRGRIKAEGVKDAVSKFHEKFDAIHAAQPVNYAVVGARKA